MSFYPPPASGPSGLWYKDRVNAPQKTLILSERCAILLIFAAVDLTGWGSVTVGYSFRLIGSLRLGAQVVYSSNDQKIRDSGSEIGVSDSLPVARFDSGAAAA